MTLLCNILRDRTPVLYIYTIVQKKRKNFKRKPAENGQGENYDFAHTVTSSYGERAGP